MTPLDYDYLRKCLKARSGLVLSADKEYLVESRLLPVARKAGLANLGELVAALKAEPEDALMTAVVEAMTTNESFFFRDKIPFDHFRSTIMPALVAARKSSRCIRIWCAAASSRRRRACAAIPRPHSKSTRDRRESRPSFRGAPAMREARWSLAR